MIFSKNKCKLTINLFYKYANFDIENSLFKMSFILPLNLGAENGKAIKNNI